MVSRFRNIFFIAAIALISLALALPSAALAQQNTPTISSRDKDLISEVLKEKADGKKPEKKKPALNDHDRALIEEVLKSKVAATKSAPPELTATVKPSSDDKLLILDEEYLQAYHDWKLYKIEIARQTFTFHYWSSLIIFGIVLGIVFMGLYLTWVQVTMRIDAERLREAQGNSDGKEKDREQHQVELSAEGLKLKSSVVGLSILTVSLGFFYLYLVHVYPISFVGQ